MLRFALLGDPVEHSLSPRMHLAAMKAMGVEGEYIAIQVSSDEFVAKVEELRCLGYRGANVTIPHKKAARDIAIPNDEASRELGVANALLFENGLHCKNTDLPGFMEALGPAAPGVALVIGAGGAALAAIWALIRAGWSVKVWSRNLEGARSVCRFPRSAASDCPDPRGCDLVVNATPIGLEEGELPPGEWDNLEAGATVFDMAYRDGQTDLLRFAAARGNRIVDGREMLVAQGALSLEWWTGVAAPRDVMRFAVGL